MHFELDLYSRIYVQKLFIFENEVKHIFQLNQNKLINQIIKPTKIVCDWRESNPRPLVHKTSALPIELQSLRLKIYNYVIAKNDDEYLCLADYE